MSTSALILMILVQGAVTVITTYFLYKALHTHPKADTEPSNEEDIENDL
jgi:hypothetical protein